MREDEDRTPKPVSHVVGEDLSRLSVEELGARIALLEGEIRRLEAARATKGATRAAAEALFRTP
jgi:uncharacterized small protein (DUF1192 family)